MSKKKEELNLKGPDLLQAKAVAAAEYLRRHSVLVAGVLIGLVVVVVAALGINALLDSQKERLRQELAQVEKIYDDELEAFSESQEKLQDQLDDLKLEQQRASGEERTRLDVQVANLEAQLAAASPDHSHSQEAFREFFEQHPNNPAGWVAGIRFAAIAVENRDLESARPVLEKLADRSTQYPILQTQSQLMLVAVLEDLEDFSAALNRVEQLLKTVAEELKPKVLLAKGRLQVFQQDFEQAQQTFAQIVEQHDGSQEAESARSMMALLF